MLNFFKQITIRALTRAIIPVILILVVGAIIRQCDHKKVREVTREQLRLGEKAAIIIDRHSNSIVAITAGGAIGNRIRSTILRGRLTKPQDSNGQTVTRTDGARGVRISVGSNGSITVTARTKGFCFEPGVGIYTTPRTQRLFLDSQFLFWRRHGINGGVGLSLGKPRYGAAHIAYSYTVYSNTSLILGIDTSKDLLLGIRVKF